jgi:putative hydroxymethylpyrimidine transport system substrate-binding protein
MRRRCALLVGAILAALTLTACGEKKDTLTPTAAQTQPLNLMLDWLPNADHVGLYAALADGDFGKAGLAVHVHVPTDPATPLELLAAGKVDAAISYEPQLLLARDAGEPLVAIAAIVQRPLTSIVSLHSKHITTPQDLRGKKIGDAGIPYQQAYLKTILAHANVPAQSVKEVNVGANLVPAMLSGRVDATLGAYWNYEAIQLRQAGKRPNVIHVEDAGVPTYDELVVVVRENEIANQNGELRRFVQALGRGYQAVRADPQAGVDALVRANPSLTTKLQLASVTATLPSFFPAAANLPWGWQDQKRGNVGEKYIRAGQLLPKAATNASPCPDDPWSGQPGRAVSREH